MKLLALLRARSTRLLTAWVAVSMLLFQQLALAAYACPALDPQQPEASLQSTMVECADMAMGSAALDPQAPALCGLDCQNSSTTRPLKHVEQDPAPCALLLYFVPVADLRIPDDDPRIDAVSALHADPPLTQRFCRLLI